MVNMNIRDDIAQKLCELKASESQSYNDVIERLIELVPNNIWVKK